MINLDYFPDDLMALKTKIDKDILDKIDLILLLGGTGIAVRDITIEAMQLIMTKELPGFGEEFRRRSYDQIKGNAFLSRSTAGTKNHSLIVGLPGSPKAVEVGITLVLEFLGHANRLLKGG